MAKRMLTRTEVIKANEFLKLHLIPSDREGFFKYQDGWDDAKIAQELDPAIQAHSIGTLRTELFGKLDTTANVAREDNGRIKAIEESVANLVNCLNDYKLRYDELIDTLALNRVVPTNINHLKTSHKEQK